MTDLDLITELQIPAQGTRRAAYILLKSNPKPPGAAFHAVRFWDACCRQRSVGRRLRFRQIRED